MGGVVKSLPAHWYANEEIFQLEQERIFSKNWSFVAHAGQIEKPGSFVTATIAGVSIIVLKSPEHGIRGFVNICRHRAAPLCTRETGEITRFTCPYHAWSYDLDGALLSAPGVDLGRDMDASKFGLIPVRVSSWNHLIFACLDRDCVSLSRWLGDIVSIAGDYPSLSEMDYACMQSNQCEINWKNYSDNSAEGYHLSRVHPELSRSLITRQTRIKVHENGQFVGFDITYKEGESVSPGYWVYKYPGLLMHFSLSSFNVEKVTPLGPTRTGMHRWFWFKPGVGEPQRKQVVSLSNQVIQQDMDICREVQKNLESGLFQDGMLFHDREPGTIYFQQCVRESLGEQWCDES